MTRPSPLRRRLRALGAALATIVAAACMPTADVNQAQLMLDLNDVMNEIRQENAVLQDQVDSLREAVARQDTLFQRFANVNGLVLPAR